jgi:hypothetical protein
MGTIEMRQGLFDLVPLKIFASKEAVMDGRLFGSKSVFPDKISMIGKSRPGLFYREVVS